MKSHKLCGCLHGFVPDLRIKQCDLIADCARNHVEGLLHIAELLSLLFIGDPVCRLALDQHLAGIWPVKSQEELKDRTLSHSGASCECYLLAGIDREIQVI